MRLRSLAAVTVCALTLAGCLAGESADSRTGDESRPPVVLVMDASGSMRQDDVSGTRMGAAKKAARVLLDSLPEQTPFATVVYGTESTGKSGPEKGCGDVKTLVEYGPVNVPGAQEKIDQLQPKGWTPIGPSIRAAAELLPDGVGEAMIVVISDGEDKCTPPPCDVAKELADKRPDLTISTVGFRASDEGLECVARETDGVYVTADNADQLASRLVAVTNPEQATAQLSPQGVHGISLGMSVADAAKEAPDFPTDGEKATEGGRTVVRIVWRDCTWTFTDDALTSIEPKGDAAATIDGVKVGDPISNANQYYGEPAVRTTGEGLTSGQKEYLYPAVVGAGNDDDPTGWKVITDSSDRIVTITLCRCAPAKWRDADITLAAGGGLTIDGQALGRGNGNDTIEGLTDLLGEPDEVTEQDACFNDEGSPNTRYRWGDLILTILAEQPEGEYGFSFPVGSVTGWTLDPTADGQAGTTPDAPGPNGSKIGDSLAQLQSVHEGKWDSTGVETVGERRGYLIFAGDTTGAFFALSDDDRVEAMSAGITCRD